MEIAYKPPNILHLDISLDDCISIEDMYDEMILGRSEVVSFEDSVSTHVRYDKIPKIFTGVESWPKSTNLKCWSCDFSFESRPCFIPTEVKETSFQVHGNFCSFPCAALYINSKYKTQSEVWKLIDNLYFLYKKMYGVYVCHIPLAPDRYCMRQYGGTMEPHEFREKINQIERDLIGKTSDTQIPA